METSTADVTVRVVEPEIEFRLAVIVVVPGATPVADPNVPLSSLMLAVPIAEEVH